MSKTGNSDENNTPQKPPIINEKSMAFLHEYLKNFAPTGIEAPGQKIWLDYIKPYIDDWKIDNYGTVYGIINPEKPYKVVIEAHADEIAWYVHHITKNGYIYVLRNGGSDHIIAPSKRVKIHGKKGLVDGVFGWPAIHVRRGDKAKLSPTVNNIFLDVGATSREEVLEMGIHIGAMVTYPDELMVMNDKYFVGRALDNKMGGFCIAEVARLLKENNVELPFALYVVNAVQEEVGLRGATMIADTIKPHAAIVTDVCHDTTTPMMDVKKLGEVTAGKGPELTFAPAVHRKLLGLVLDAAEEKEIPFQLAASSRSTGTDTDAFAFSNGGVPSVLISLPLKYMHTTVETAHKDDVENVIRLIYETLLKIEENHNFKYF